MDTGPRTSRPREPKQTRRAKLSRRAQTRHIAYLERRGRVTWRGRTRCQVEGARAGLGGAFRPRRQTREDESDCIERPRDGAVGRTPGEQRERAGSWTGTCIRRRGRTRQRGRRAGWDRTVSQRQGGFASRRSREGGAGDRRCEPERVGAPRAGTLDHRLPEPRSHVRGNRGLAPRHLEHRRRGPGLESSDR